MKNTIGENIAKYRKAARFTQEELAEKMNVTAQAVSKWENDLSYPDLDTTAKLASQLGTSVDALIQGREEIPTVSAAGTEMIDKRILVITADDKRGSNTKVRIPVELILKFHESGMLNELIDDETAVKAVTTAIGPLFAGTVGTIVEADGENGFAKIEVIDYDA